MHDIKKKKKSPDMPFSIFMSDFEMVGGLWTENNWGQVRLNAKMCL